jgi:hypothetical protein
MVTHSRIFEFSLIYFFLLKIVLEQFSVEMTVSLHFYSIQKEV